MEPPTAREVIARLLREGYVLVGCAGDHRKLTDGTHVVIVPGKLGAHLRPGTWASVRRQVGWR